MTKMKLSYHDQSNEVWSVMKTRQENDLTDIIDLVFVEIEIELSGLI